MVSGTVAAARGTVEAVIRFDSATVVRPNAELVGGVATVCSLQSLYGMYVSTQRRLSGTHGCVSLRFHRLQCDAVCAVALLTIASHWTRTCRTMRGTPLPNECQRLWPNTKTEDWSLRVLRQTGRRAPAGSAVQSSLVHSTANGFDRFRTHPKETHSAALPDSQPHSGR